MKVQIKIPRYLESALHIDGIVEVEGRSIDECLRTLVLQHPDLRSALFSDEGKLLLKWMVYLNNRLVPSTSALSQEVSAGDVIGLIPVFPGG